MLSKKKLFFYGLIIGILAAYFFAVFPVGVIEIIYERY